LECHLGEKKKVCKKKTRGNLRGTCNGRKKKGTQKEAEKQKKERKECLLFRTKQQIKGQQQRLWLSINIIILKLQFNIMFFIFQS